MLNGSNLQSNEDKKSEKTVENRIQSDIQLNRNEEETIGSVPNLLCLLPVFLVMLQQLKKENDQLKTENDELKEKLELSETEIKRMTFPLLSLPNEIIGHIYSFLPIKIRMRARLCKRLDNIEMKYNYFVPRFIIDEVDAKKEYWRRLLDGRENKYLKSFITENKDHAILVDRGHPLTSLKRIMRNATFGFLNVDILGKGGHFSIVWNIYQLITECNIIELNLQFPFSILSDEILVDKYLFGLMNACCKLKLGTTGTISASGLHTLYKKIMERTCKLYFINFASCPEMLLSTLREFLLLIEIRFDEGGLLSARNIEAYNFKKTIECVKDEEEIEDEDDENEEDDEEEEDVFRMNKHVFDGNLEIVFGFDGHGILESRWLSMNYHKTNEELVKAKAREGLVRFEVSPQ